LLNWVELDAAALRWNLGQFRQRLEPGARIGAVVKANAYGHGMVQVAQAALAGGADWLCVNSVGEAVELRGAGHDVPILVMGYIPLEALEAVVEHRLRPVVYNRETLERLAELARAREAEVAVHLKVETGTHRQGIPEPDVPELAGIVHRSDGLMLEGLTTHFANIEDSTDHAFAESQIAAFSRIEAGLRDAGIEVPMRHTACSAATLLFARTHMELVRIGISLYGLWPSRETYVSCLDRGRPALDLRPVMTWKTRVAQVKTVPEGAYVGYGCTYRATRESRIAVLPVGYFEGYGRSLSGVGHVLIRGRRAPLRGRVCMNMCMVDVTDISGVRLEDEVVLLGGQGDERVSAEQIAAWCGTIAYEVVSRVHPSLPRIVVDRSF
jgi:alanine racemase